LRFTIRFVPRKEVYTMYDLHASKSLSEPMKPVEIKAEILRRGWSQKALARKIGCSESQLSQVINGHRVNQPLRQKLARKLGLQVKQVFGKHHPQPSRRDKAERKAH